MKQRLIRASAVLVPFVVVGVVVGVVTDRHETSHTLPAFSATQRLAELEKQPAVALPVAEQTAIETAVVNGILTNAPAGSQAQAKITSCSATTASGLLMYDSGATPTYFTAQKDAAGSWKVTSYIYLGPAPSSSLSVGAPITAQTTSLTQ